MAKNLRPDRSAAPVPEKPARDLLGKAYPYLLPLLLFLSVTAISRQFAVGFVAACFVLALGRTPLSQLRRQSSPLVLAVGLYVLVCLLSGLWCHFGSYAARESIKLLIALAVFGLVLSRTGKDRLQGLLWSLNGVLAVVSLLCVDAGSWQVLARGFSTVMKLFHSSYPLEAMGYESGIRITGIFSNANVSAGMIAFGLVVSLYLYQTAACKKGRIAAAVAVGVEALAFFLSFSMGAMGAFAVTCLVYVLCAGKGRRLSLFLLMLECVLVTVLCAFGAYPFLGTGSILPVLLALVCGPVIWALDTFVGSRVLAALENRSKAVGVAAGALVAAVAVYVVLAFSLTGGTTLTAGESLSRAVYPAPGDYTVIAEGADAQALVYSQNEAELMMHTTTVLYQGSLADASFTVPEDSRMVWFVLEGDGELSSLTLSDGTKVPLGYKLLPGFAANRLQGLKANQNFIQRLVFFRDGMELWKQSPLLGWGIGGVEGQLTAVQSFYYESKYIHNHLIQIMDEAGLLGLAAFVFLLGSAIWTLVRRRKDQREPIFAMLAACLTMMTAHSLTEVVWSAQMYQVVVFVLLAVLVIQYHEPREARPAVALGRVLTAGLWAVALVFGALQASSLLAASTFQKLETSDITLTEFISTLQRLDRMEVYDDSSYKINIMANSLQMGGTSNRGTAARMARELAATEEFDACYHAAAYYYLPLKELDGFFEVSQLGLRQEASNPDAWNSIARLYAQAAAQMEADDMAEFIAGVAAYQDLLEAFNASGRMEQIVLEENNQAFLNCAVSLRESGVEGEAALLIMGSVIN